jgi:hypothetical protein
MIPIGLAALLFLLFTLFGKAFLELLRFRLPVLRNWLIAPTVGFTLIEILVCFFNQFCNLPVKAFAGWMLSALLLGSVAVFWLRKPVFPGRQLAPFGGVLAFSLLYTGWPALIHGFNWMSFVNYDMTYFSAGAVRMLAHPFYSIPPVQDLLGRDYTQYTWASQVVAQVRAGGEMLLAWCAGVTGLHPLQIYMPSMLALQLAQLCACGALVLAQPRFRRVAILAVAVLSLSPLFSLGTLYQLLPQAGGLPAMLVLALLLATGPERPGPVWPYTLVLATILSGLFLHYPEVIAFGAIPAVLYRCVRAFQRRRIPWVWLAGVAASGLIACIMIREALLAGIVNTLGNIKNNGLTGVTPGDSLFPEFMIPSGLANLFGLMPFGRYFGEPLLSSLILIGLVLLAVAVFQTAGDASKGRIYAYMLGFMVVVAVVFLRGANDYGLFKVAMFSQPALAACFSFLAVRISSRWRWIAPVLVLAATLPAQTRYTTVSAGLTGGGIVEVPEISHFGLNFAVPKIAAISDINLVPAQGLAAILFRGSIVLYPSIARGKFTSEPGRSDRDNTVVDKPGVAIPGSRPERADKSNPRHDGHEQDTSVAPPVSNRVKGFINTLATAAAFPARRFAEVRRVEDEERVRQMNQPENAWGTDFFAFSPHLKDSIGRMTHLLTLQREFLFNSTSPVKDAVSYGTYRLVPYNDVHNWLLFIPSSRGPDYFYDHFGASFYQPEADPYRPRTFMSAMGRFLLMQVLQPTGRLRLRVSLSRSILGLGRTALPGDAVIHGGSDVVLPFVGAGSAALYSGSIAPLWKDGNAYLAIDLGESAATFPNVKTGLMKLYNHEFSIDQRRLVAFGRDISVIPEEEYQNLARPGKIDSFPAGLLSDTGPEYSGIYEDGWISQKSFVKLGLSRKGQSIVVEGVVPPLAKLANGNLTLSVQVNDAPAEIQTVKGGGFRASVLLRESSEITTVRVQFSDSAPLPGADGRPVSALLHSISIE